nr:hypothetical protein CFP56_04434 [Quercus suber]
MLPVAATLTAVSLDGTHRYMVSRASYWDLQAALAYRRSPGRMHDNGREAPEPDSSLKVAPGPQTILCECCGCGVAKHIPPVL